MREYHIPVLLKEVIEYLNVKPGEKYVDCTLGGGGHGREILEQGGILLGIDQDPEAILHAQKKWDMGSGRLEKEVGNGKLVLKHGNFAHLKEIATEAGFERVSGVLFDLGVSSHQLETDYRGFSFGSPRGEAGRQAKLDMRMDPVTQTVMAADLVNAGSEEELANLFWRFGEERDSRRIARAIVENRKAGKQVRTTEDLVRIVLSVSRKSSWDRTHPATRVFQALRIAVNDELAALEAALPQAVELLEPGGRLAVISFHSLEDRIVKNFMRDMGKMGKMREVTGKPITPGKEEVGANPRARSGKLRIGERVDT